MKNKIKMPSEAYTMLGFPIPSKQPMEHRGVNKNQNEYENEINCKVASNVSSYLDRGERIVDLTRKKSYCSEVIELMEGIDILKIPFSRVPMEVYKQSDYFIRTIKRYVRSKLADIPDWEAFQKEGLPFLRLLLGIYYEKMDIISPSKAEVIGRDMCTETFCSKFTVMLQFQGIPDFQCFCGIGNMKQKNSGYYHYRKKMQHHVCCLIDTEILLAHIAMYNCIYMLASGSGSSLTDEYLRIHIDNMKMKCTEQECDHLEQIMTKKEPLPLQYLFDSITLRKKGGKFTTFRPNIRMVDFLSSVFFDIVQLYQDITYEVTHRKGVMCKSAPPYITKKNIPLKVQKAMESSEFNGYFGYVEFDEAMDLDAVKLIEDEFKSINKDYFYGCVFKNVKLRFRKLGRHRAGGLYYFSLNTLCVDIRNPDSFVHEYFHMIDDQLGNLSLRADFSKVVTLYRTALRANMGLLSTDEAAVLKGNGKYNLKYYFRRAEILAHCGEIYLGRILNVESSLLKCLDENETVYPNDWRLQREIEIYYEKLFDSLKNEP